MGERCIRKVFKEILSTNSYKLRLKVSTCDKVCASYDLGRWHGRAKYLCTRSPPHRQA